jgi:branched-chain amino acid transport system permease protein
MRMPALRITGLRLGVSLVVLVVFLAAPLIVKSDYALNLAAMGLIYAVVSASWDVTLGYGGLFNFAHAAMFGVGAYTSGVAAAKFGVSPWLSLLIGIAATVVTSVLIFLPVSRLRGIYVALITFAAAQLIMYLAVTQTDLTGGNLGLTNIPPLTLGSLDFGRNEVATYYLAGGLLIVTIAVLRRLVTSDFGLGLVGLRDFEEYAVSRGVSAARQRLWAFVASAGFTGAAGGIYTFYLLSLSPEIFGFSLTTLFLSMLLVGGIATIYGPAAAAIGLTFLSDALSPLGPWRFVVYGIMIVLVILFFPSGFWGLGGDIRDRLARSRRVAGGGSTGGAPVDAPAGGDAAVTG